MEREQAKAVLEAWLSSVVRPVVIEGILSDLGYPKLCLVEQPKNEEDLLMLQAKAEIKRLNLLVDGLRETIRTLNNTKHRCNPCEETPDADSKWACSCGVVWRYLPERNVWHSTAEAINEIPPSPHIMPGPGTGPKKQGSRS